MVRNISRDQHAADVPSHRSIRQVISTTPDLRHNRLPPRYVAQHPIPTRRFAAAG